LHNKTSSRAKFKNYYKNNDKIYEKSNEESTTYVDGSDGVRYVLN